MALCFPCRTGPHLRYWSTHMPMAATSLQSLISQKRTRTPSSTYADLTIMRGLGILHNDKDVLRIVPYGIVQHVSDVETESHFYK
jgi:hypothetical protein